MADQGWSDIYVVFTKILCCSNFYVWEVTKLKFTGELQMASLSLYTQFETNLIVNCKVIELLLQLKSAKTHVKVQMKCFFLFPNLKEQQKSGRSPFTVS